MSALRFRNVESSPHDPIDSWPVEAIQTGLERGGLSEWRRLAAAVRADPWGPVARAVEEVLSHSRPFGVAEAMERVIARARRATEENERQAVADEVRRAIERSGMSRVEFASRVGTSASRLSTYATGKVVPSAALMLRMERASQGHTGSVPNA
ncbi:MAG TPA: helix-turn-helix transcriptional regulator [Solirubrobacterales bacterium]